MAGFIYFLPGAPAANDARLKDAGLSHVIGRPYSFGAIDRGPGGGSGCLVALDGMALAFAPDQEWREVSELHVFIGWPKEAKPMPTQLARPDLVDGHAVKLSDGQEWIVPLARAFGLAGPRHKSYRLGPGGKWVLAETVERLMELESDAAEIFGEIDQQVKVAAEAAKAGKEWPGLHTTLRPDVAAKALMLNYFIGAPEIDALRLLGTDNVGAVQLALIDWPTLEAELQKKNQVT